MSKEADVDEIWTSWGADEDLVLVDGPTGPRWVFRRSIRSRMERPKPPAKLGEEWE